MIAECLSVGTELLLGEIVDTNSAWLARDLAARGVDVYWSQRVGDNKQRIQAAIEQALLRSDLLLMCGGLGPTDDDVTREAIAATLEETPLVDAKLEADLRARFASFSRNMPERNLKQAWLIPSATSLANPIGTAPGWLLRLQRQGKEKIIITLPGPPREMTRMWLQEALPQLALPQAALYSKTFKTHGLGESHIAEQLGALTLQANPSVATYAKRDGVHVRVAAKAADIDSAQQQALPVLEQVRHCLAEAIWGEDEDELANVIIEALQQQQCSLVSLEAASGGLLAERLGSVSGADTVYRAGVVAWGAQIRTALGLPASVSSEASSQEHAEALARALNEHFASDYALVVGELQANTAVSEQSGKRQLSLALCSRSAAAPACVSTTLTLPFSEPAWLRERVTFASLALLWRQLRQAQQ